MRSQRWIDTDTILLTAGLPLIGCFVRDVLLLVLGAVLLAIELDGASRAISGRLPVSRRWALVGITISITAFIVGAMGMTATRFVQQFRQVGDTMVDSLERAVAWLTELGVIALMEEMNDEDARGRHARTATSLARPRFGRNRASPEASEGPLGIRPRSRPTAAGSV